mgnify:FL=1
MKNRKLDNIIEKFYKEICIEDERLTKDKMHKIEFITTTNYIEKYLKPGDRILEIGAGTGAYSLYYANKGYKVDAIELSKSNVEVFKSKITKDLDVNVIQGNAVDLSVYKDNTFDITLCLGPLYHLFKEEETTSAIKEAIRVTKPGGKIYLAFILFDLTMLTWGFKEKNVYENYGENKQISENFKPNNAEELIFNMRYFEDIKKLIKSFNLKTINYVATDGIGRVIKDEINQMSEEEYNLYIKYHLSICEREDLIGYSGHILAILEK